jgi:GT2 family glycosyltransferase
LLANPPSEPWEIIWIDDCSTDGTREWLKSIESGNCRVIFNETNKGYATNNNRGASLARGDTLIFLNNDLELEEGWLEPLLESLDRVEKVGVVGNIQVQHSTGLIDHAGVWFDLAGCPGHLHKGEQPESLIGNGSFSKAVTAACWATRKKTFDEVGGFDTTFRNGAEDIDLCLKLHQRGYRHWVDYRSQVRHHVSASPGRKLMDTKNQAIFLKRWGELTSQFGQEDWPREYLKRILKHPTQINATKTLDALLRFVHLKSGSSNWATRRREKLISDA